MKSWFVLVLFGILSSACENQFVDKINRWNDNTHHGAKSQQDETRKEQADKKELKIRERNIKPGREVKISRENSSSPGMIKKIFSVGDKYYVVVDYTTLTDEETPGGNPVYENKNPRLRTFIITPETIIRAYPVWRKDYQGRMVKISLEEFLKYKDYQISDYTKWNFVVRNGVVVKLTEIYFA